MDSKKIIELPVAQNLGDTSVLPVSVNMGSFWQTFKLSLSTLKTYLSGFFVTKTSLNDLVTKPLCSQEGQVLVASDDGTSSWSNTIGGQSLPTTILGEVSVYGKIYVPAPNGDTSAFQAARQGTLDDRVPSPTNSTADKYLRSSDDGTANWHDVFSGVIIPTYANEMAAHDDQLEKNSIYKTPTGELRIKL